MLIFVDSFDVDNLVSMARARMDGPVRLARELMLLLSECEHVGVVVKDEIKGKILRRKLLEGEKGVQWSVDVGVCNPYWVEDLGLTAEERVKCSIRSETDAFIRGIRKMKDSDVTIVVCSLDVRKELWEGAHLVREKRRGMVALSRLLCTKK